MRLALLLALAIAASGCVRTAAPVVVIAPPPVREVEPPPGLPEPALPTPEVVDLEPLEPPPTPRLQIDRRAVYEQAGVVEWTLANGLTVVYLHEPGADAYRVRVQAPTGWADLPATARGRYADAVDVPWSPLIASVEPSRRVAKGQADRVTDLVDAVAALFTETPPAGGGAVAEAFDRPASFVVALSGAAEREWIEPVIATRLASLRGRDSGFGPILDAPEPVASALRSEVAATWEDLPAAAVLAQALADRDRAARLTFDGHDSRVRLSVDGPASRADTFRPFTDDALRQARATAAGEAATPDGRLTALATLYEIPGAFRPARRPDEAVTLADRIERTPPDRVATLLRQLADAAVLSAPSSPETP